MSNKRTLCPTCSTIYKVTVAQLTIAQGMVCCPKCTTSFNALSHLVTEPQASATNTTPEATVESLNTVQGASEFDADLYNSKISSRLNNLLHIFDEKVENSNIDLKTYLNNLNYFSTEPISALPTMNWDEDTDDKSSRSVVQYAGWTAINVLLLAVLVFQFFWFNPQYLKNSHVMGTAFNAVCDVFNCSNMEEHYNLINTKKVKIIALDSKQTQFTGELINYHDRSLAMPILRLDLKDNGVITASYTLSPSEYLIESLVRIERIPQNSPFKFDFKVPVERKSFDSYTLEIIRP
ncbi:hypothetical protein BS636_14270 [Acinetobacter sp. LoGeW2-3]|uniref:DUF3426 domain-containing protein n=1 Tax=Acinetobacter sp. LoGeW2-3 TaxID=1808001 RepID=UPI000C059AD4|nr:DUF3426 domain-containing protein [Acinetobacter sp. LoGeW2-3]ATO20762.1 hypothetical protein BS636_14270 [Acinetobacter sp. LoGeW2-3]